MAGKKGRPLGWRKPLDKVVQYTTFTVVCTPEQKSKIIYDASATGKSISRYIVDTILGEKGDRKGL